MQAASSESLQTKAGAETDDKKEQGGDGRDRRVPDRICMESDSDSIFYYILNRIRIRIQLLSDTNTK